MKTYIKNTYSILFILSLLFFILCLIPINVKGIDIDNAQVTLDGDRLAVTGAGGYTTDDAGVDKSTTSQTSKVSQLFEKYKKIIVFLDAMASITMLGLFIKHIIIFAGTGTEHWILRRQAMFGLLWSGIAFALLGSSTLILTIFYHAFE